MAICIAIGVTAGTDASKPYDQRTYLLTLTILGFFPLMWFGWQESRLSKKLKRHKKDAMSLINRIEGKK